jgi:hypothetical protein
MRNDREVVGTRRGGGHHTHWPPAVMPRAPFPPHKTAPVPPPENTDFDRLQRRQLLCVLRVGRSSLCLCNRTWSARRKKQQRGAADLHAGHRQISRHAVAMTGIRIPNAHPLRQGHEPAGPKRALFWASRAFLCERASGMNEDAELETGELLLSPPAPDLPRCPPSSSSSPCGHFEYISPFPYFCAAHDSGMTAHEVNVALYRACQSGDTEAAVAAVEEGADVNAEQDEVSHAHVALCACRLGGPPSA